MKNQIPVVKNQDYIVDVVGFGYEGEGVGKIESFPIFINGALKGEKVKAKIVKVNKNMAFGKLIEIIEKSKDRVEPICEFYKNCGGCTIQHLSYEGQLKLKKDRVYDCIERIGGFDIKKDAIEVFDTMGVDTPYRYRNKVQLPTRNKDGAKIGFYAVRSHDIVDINSCIIQFEEADKVIEVVREYINKYKIETYDEEKHIGNIRHIMIRKGFKTGELMVVIVTKEDKLEHSEELLKSLKDKLPKLMSFIQNINDKKTNVVLGDKNRLLYGKGTIVDYIGDFKFNISPMSFFQVNSYQTEKLYEKALEYASLTGDENVIDAYCGTGTISLFLSQKAKKVYGVEIVEQAIEDAKINAKENKVNNVEFFAGKCEKIIPRLIKDGIKPDVIVVDPPRKGCDKDLIDTMIEAMPERIVYVSCDPSTLARDLKILCEGGYQVKKVQPVDMFAMTSHVETVALLHRK